MAKTFYNIILKKTFVKLGMIIFIINIYSLVIHSEGFFILLQIRVTLTYVLQENYLE